MALSVEDIRLLRNGSAPGQLDLIRDMTLGAEVWLDPFTSHYLDTYIPAGGCKFKLLVGEEGSGKSHLLRAIEDRAVRKGYATLFLSARTAGSKLCDVPSLYKLIAANLSKETLSKGMACAVAGVLGYGPNLYDGSKELLPYVIEEGFDAPDAMREIRITTARLLRQSDLGASFFTCANTLLRDRLLQADPQAVRIAWKWLTGEKLDSRERRESGLYEVLNRTTARRWLDGLLKLIVLSGHKGIALLVDDLDVLHERNQETGRFHYTPAANKDTYELFRQLIDDADLLRHFLIVVAGRRSLIEDDRRGFKSYEALWMRLQTGLVPSSRFNPLCDIVDMDQHLAALGADFPARLSRHLPGVFDRYGIRKKSGSSGIASMDAAAVTASGNTQTPSLKTAVRETLYTADPVDVPEVEE